ncbi:MAG: hypothetical protein JXR31_04725, partial [Prolixibacteraceae bacterium]|nr:hypothetical protein [Prolixibacteraceae bacterium]
HIFPILIWPLVLVFMLWFYPEKRAWFWTLFFISTVGFIFFFLKSKGLRKQLTFLLIAQFVFFISLNISIMPSMFNYYSTFKACEIFNAEAEKNEILHSYRLRYWSLFTNSNNYGYWIRDDEKMKEVLKQGNSWIFTDEAGLNALNIWNAEYTVKGEFNHRNITGQSFKFLNPKTRDQHFKKYYLIKLE